MRSRLLSCRHHPLAWPRHECGSNLIPLIGLPAVVLEASEATTIDIAVLALLSVLTPSLASDYVGLLERLAAIERAAHRRFGTLLPLPPGPFLRWSDALDALTGRRFLPWVAARRRLVAAQRHFWRHLRRQVEPEGQRRARRRSPPALAASLPLAYCRAEGWRAATSARRRDGRVYSSLFFAERVRLRVSPPFLPIVE
ncbi:MAG: hypothetical protein KatS3mg061_1929 [Dehalococcoidia bacterium]|nr:MAG: hypothetical protein KatS3mg061_1929 [Dehalococcoidia bacterium]